MKLLKPKRTLWVVCCFIFIGVLFSGCGLFQKSEKQEVHRVPVHKLDTTLKAIERDISRAHKYLKGSIVLALTIEPDGEISEIKVKENLLNEPQVEKDIVHMFKSSIIIENSSQDGLKLNIPLIFE